MANPKPLAKEDLVEALKDLPTKKDVKKIVDDSIHHQLSEFHANMTKPALKGLEKRLNSRFDKVESRLDNLEVGQALLKDKLDGLTADLSDTPSRRQFEKLKARVDKYHPLT